jgi:hypothetical protein
MQWLGKMKWLLLPLPPQTRDSRLDWTDAAYYIYPGRRSALEFPGVWEESKDRKRKQPEEA